MANPFAKYKMQPTKGIDSIPALIFGNDLHTCKIRDISFTNTRNIPLIVKIFIKREISVGNVVDYEFEERIDIEAKKRISLLLGEGITLEAGDTLYAYCDEIDGNFNAFVFYDEFLET